MKAALKTRLTTMDAAEAKRNLKGNASQDTPVRNRGIREWAPGRGVRGSDNPAQIADMTHGGVKRDALGVGEGYSLYIIGYQFGR